MAKKKGLMDRIGDAVEAARREVKTTTAKAERDVKRGVKTVATRVKKAAIKVEKAVSAKPAAPRKATPGMKLDKGIASVKRAGKKAEAAVRGAVSTARKPAAKPAKRTTRRTTTKR
jgi:hypothetical protein